MDVKVKHQELNFSRRAPGYFTKVVTGPHLSQVIVARFHVVKTGVVDLTPETAGKVGV